MGNYNLFAWLLTAKFSAQLEKSDFADLLSFNFCINLRHWTEIIQGFLSLQSQISQAMQSNTLQFHGLVFSHAMFLFVVRGTFPRNLHRLKWKSYISPYFWARCFDFGLNFFFSWSFLAQELCIHTQCAHITAIRFTKCSFLFYVVSCATIQTTQQNNKQVPHARF